MDTPVQSKNTNSSKEVSIVEQTRNYKVIKSNELIQKTRYSLSTQSQKIILYLISKIRAEDTEFKMVTFKISEFCELCGIENRSGRTYDSVKKTLKTLADKSVWIYLDDGRETLMRWIERPYIDSKSGTIQIKIDELMKPYLLQLRKKFTQYNLYYTLPMRSQYSIRLYEFLKSFEYKKAFEFDIEELKKMFMAENYSRYPDFKNRVLRPAISEVNEYTDIYITYKEIKSGRKYSSIYFMVEKKEDFIEQLKAWHKTGKKLDPEKETLYERLIDDGRS